jgi:plasmid maintenance system antidote protein VapI
MLNLQLNQYDFFKKVGIEHAKLAKYVEIMQNSISLTVKNSVIIKV